MKLGKAYIKTDGDLLDTEKGAKIDIGGSTRNAITGEHTVDFSEQLTPSKIECEVMLSAGMSLDKIRKISNATVTFECDTGQSYIVRNAFCSETLKITAGEGGKIPCVFMGPPAEEVLA